MQYPIVLLLLVSYGTAAPLSIYEGEDNAFHPIVHRNVEFFHRIGDWIRNTKNRVVNRLFGIDPVAIPGTDGILGVDLLELQNRVKQDGLIPLDLSSLSLDPAADLGFQVGDWYFIRRNQGNHNAYNENDWSGWSMYPAFTLEDRTRGTTERTSRPDYTQYDEVMGSSRPTLPVLPLLPTDLSIPNAVTQSTSQDDTQMASTSPTAEDTDTTTEKFSTVGKRVEDNELDNELSQPASIEIFM